ncbi:MAG: glycosyltransferase family 39 protein, partial [Vicinamibacterales bacterium]
MPPRAREWRTLVVFLAALLLFSLRLTLFEARQTDISALRVLAGDVPYRDFWTMYAPGSFVLLAGVFRLVGAQLVVSNALGILTSAAGVAVYFSLVRRAATDVAAALAAALVAAVYFGTGYSDGFTSYPPALLLILVALRMVVDRADTPGVLWAVRPGLLLGAAALFKHDTAVYAAVAFALALITVRASDGAGRALAPVAVLAGCTALLPLGALVVLVRLGAAADAWTDLVQWPLGDFRYV